MANRPLVFIHSFWWAWTNQSAEMVKFYNSNNRCPKKLNCRSRELWRICSSHNTTEPQPTRQIASDCGLRFRWACRHESLQALYLIVFHCSYFYTFCFSHCKGIKIVWKSKLSFFVFFTCRDTTCKANPPLQNYYNVSFIFSIYLTGTSVSVQICADAYKACNG